MSERLVIIGLDGVPYGLLKDLAEKGVMPNCAKLIKKGVFKAISSTVPEISSVAWSTIITGTNPGEHGVFGFTDFKDGGYGLRFPDFSDLKSAPFWEASGKPAVILNVPSTYPVREMNGAHISGFVSPDISKSVYPESLIPALKRIDYRLDADSSKAYVSMRSFINDIDHVSRSLAKVSRLLWDSCPWEIFMIAFTTTDRLMHFLYSAYKDERHVHHKDFIRHFRSIDSYIGDISFHLKKSDRLILLSDHGFEEFDLNVYLNRLLEDAGLLSIRPLGQGLEAIEPGSLALALDPARIYINLKTRFRSGSVSADDREAVRDRIINTLRDKTINGRKIIKSIHKKEDIYAGKAWDNAPDLVLVGEKGINFSARVNVNVISDKPIFTGKHKGDNAFILSGPDLSGPMQGVTSVEDCGRLILSLSKGDKNVCL